MGLIPADSCCGVCRITNAGLPSGLARLPYLKSIGLKRNCLTSVPRMLGQMHSLQEIYLEDNNDLEVWCYPEVKSEKSACTAHCLQQECTCLQAIGSVHMSLLTSCMIALLAEQFQ